VPFNDEIDEDFHARHSKFKYAAFADNNIEQPLFSDEIPIRKTGNKTLKIDNSEIFSLTILEGINRNIAQLSQQIALVNTSLNAFVDISIN
jgi:hypothetical protein